MASELASPLAAIDAGSNTIHLVVARPTPDGRDLSYLADELDLTRLGEDVSATGAIGEARQTRAVAVIREQAELAHGWGATTVLGIATEGVRSASNAEAFLERIQAETGVEFALISGDQEAALTYWGATSGLPASQERRAVVDLGGGSIEIVIGTGSQIEWRTSLPLGSGAMRSRYAPSDPPVAGELDAVRAAVAEALRPLALPLPVSSVLGCGGTATTLRFLAARAQDASQPSGNAAAENHSDLSRGRLDALLRLLQSAPADEISARYGVEFERVRLLSAGAAVLLGTLERLGVAALRVTKRGIREGALLAYAHAGARWLEVAEQGAGW